MILLLDARAVLWWLADDPELANLARRSINDPANDIVVSAGTVWEIEVKRHLGKLESPPELLAALDTAESRRCRSRRLMPSAPLRCLIAQCARLDATIVTRDRAFALYDIAILPA